MFQTTASLETGYCGPAEVLEVPEDEPSVRLRLEDHEFAEARLATREAINQGDQVLVTGRDYDNLYVVGVIPSNNTRRISTASGAYVEISGPASRESLSVYSSQGQLLIEMDPRTSQTRVSVDTADLQLSAPNGNVAISAGRQIRLAAESVDVQAQRSLRAAAGCSESQSTLNLDRQGAELESKTLRVSQEQVEANVRDLHYRGKSFRLVASSLRFAADRMETVAGTVLEKAKQVFQTVTGLAQLRAGRVRQRSESTWHVKSDKAYLHSSQDFKVQGRKIHLG